MTVALAAIAVVILIALLEWGLRLRARRGTAESLRATPGRRKPLAVNAFLGKWWPYMIPGGLLLIVVGVALHVPQTGESIYTFGGITTLLGLRGGIVAALRRRKKR